MKKILILFSFLMLLCLSICAQKTKIEITNFGVNFDGDETVCDAHMKFAAILMDGTHVEIFSRRNGEGTFYYGDVYASVSGVVRSLYIEAYTREKTGDCGGSNDTEIWQREHITLNGLCGKGGYHERRRNDGEYEASNEVWFTYNIYPEIAVQKPANNSIGYDDPFNVKLSPGFPANAYKTRYQIVDTLSHVNPLAWVNLPSRYQQKQNFDIKLSDLIPSNTINKIILFQAVTPCDVRNTDTIVNYSILISAPHIDSVTYQMPTCYQNNDAKLFVHFDRELYDKEKLYLSLNGDRFTYPITINSPSKTVEITDLFADTFNISLLGNYKFGINDADTVYTYTDGVRHKYAIRLPERPAIVLDTIFESPVHCFDGRDGRVSVKVNGGNGVYDAYLEQSNIRLDSIRFTKNQTAVFKELPIGTYNVRIKDTNGCIWDASGNLVIGTITVTQPPDSVLILPSHTRWEEPKGFGLSNGWAQISFLGGTTTNYQVIWTDSLGNTIPNVITQEGITFVSKVNNIRSSTYYVTVRDANYPLADPQTEENLCGCTDTISFFVEEPPLLEVEVEQHHYVTCYGDKNGAIVAHATGGRPHLSGLPYTYDWFEVKGSSIDSIPQNDSICRQLYAGYYRVRITDRNGIFTFSDDFHLVQPDSLIVRTNVLQNIACSGDSIGSIEAIATGGTAPYTYVWSTNDTTRVISGQPQGNYVVAVRDARYAENITGHYCIAQAYDSIMAPNPIKLTAVVKNPVCNGYANGEIRVSVTGGVAPYTYLWENSTTQANRNGLTKGSYRIKATDTNSCFMEEIYTLEDPEPVVVDLGNDFILCKGQTVHINGNIGLPDISYKWTDRANATLSAIASLDITQAGSYKLTATTIDGCYGSDELTVGQSDDVVTPDFVMATKVANNTKIYAVNITRTASDSISWIIPEEVTVLNQSETDRIELLFPENGDYTIGMIAHKNRCNNTLYKTISVVDKGDVGEDTREEPFLKRFIVSPNPNNGQFQVLVELREAADYQLMLYNGNGMLIEAKEIKNKMYENTTFNLSGTTSGTYHLRLVSAKATSVFKLVIQ